MKFKPGTRRENLRRRLKYRVWGKIRTKYLRWKRNRNRPADHYVVPTMNEYHLKYGPYKTAAEFDASFDEIPPQQIGGVIRIRMPWED